MAASKKIIVLGGSYAGVSSAHYLLRHTIPQLPNPASYQLILVSTSEQVICRPACPRAMIAEGMFDQGRLFVSITSQFQSYPETNFRFINGRATTLNHISRSVVVTLPNDSTETLQYHCLVIATGASTTSPLLGITRSGDELRQNWVTFREALPRANSIVIAGGGPAGVEAAGELGEYLNGRAGYFASRLESPKVAITLVTAADQILPLLRPALAAKAETLLAKVGVTVIKNAKVVGVTPEGAGTDAVDRKATLTLEDGGTLEADIYIPAVGTRPNTDFIDKLLLAADGRVETNASTLRVPKAGPLVYAIGDVSSYARPAVHLILEAIPVVCANIKKDLLQDAGKTGGEDRLFKENKREMQMVPIGKSKGVGAAMGYAVPGWMVWAIKGRDYWLWTTANLWNGKHWAKES